MQASRKSQARLLAGPLSALSTLSARKSLMALGAGLTALLAFSGCRESMSPMGAQDDSGMAVSALSVQPGTYTLSAVHSGKCVEVPNASLSDGAVLAQMPCNGSLKQQWKLQSPSAGIWKLVSAVSGKCADVSGNSYSNGAKIHQWGCHTGDNQKFIMTDKGSGQYEFKVVSSRKCMDVTGVSVADGAQIQQWDCASSGNQKFTVSPVIIPPPTGTTACKRGYAYGGNSTADMQAMSKGVSWWYNWGTTADQGVAGTYLASGVEFVPMVWGKNFIGNADAVIKQDGAKYLLAFNEPNFFSQSNITPLEAAAMWPQIETIARNHNLKIVSPATNFCGGGCNETDPYVWLQKFFAACPNCKVDYIGAHWYACTGDALKWHIGNLKQFNRPIWLTEFSCLDGADKSVAAQKAYMTTALDILEKEPAVFRYSWFTGRFADVPSINLLGAPGQLTELGQTYVSLPQACKQ
ncbi:MAG: hypothetical protein JWP91_4125 [Fibrobacteres bacterium]|nr:hypothetical protein [Fibrobacterota bacterium]